MKDKYTYRVMWSEDDNEFVGLCSEFPSLSWLDENQESAFSGIRALVTDIVADMAENGETPPKPICSKKFSGKFTVRTLPNVHRDLVLQAAESGVSLNRLVNSKL